MSTWYCLENTKNTFPKYREEGARKIRPQAYHVGCHICEVNITSETFETSSFNRSPGVSIKKNPQFLTRQMKDNFINVIHAANPS